MSTFTPIDHYCDAWQQNGLVPDDKERAFPHVEFFIEVYAYFTYVSVDSDVEDDDIEGPMIPKVIFESPINYKSFWVQRDQLTHDGTSRVTISDMLSSVDVPSDIQPSMIDTILDRARSMASAQYNKDCKILPMVVYIGVVKDIEELENAKELMESGSQECASLES